MAYTEFETEQGTRRRYAKGNFKRYLPLLRGFVLFRFPPQTHQWVLDVGAGEGKFHDLLANQGYLIDGLEVHLPYIERFGLREKYHKLFVCDLLSFDWLANSYDLVILGDVLEHLTANDAQSLLPRIKDSGAACFVSMPFLAPQGRCRGNPYEAHQQDDLTPKLMSERYPTLSVLWRDDEYGIYAQEAP